MILITGINGFIGSHIARLLVNRGERVRGLVRNSSNLLAIKDIKSKIELVYGDIRNEKTLVPAFKDVDVCYHAAALVKSGSHSKEKYFSTNLNGTINVCEEAMRSGVKKFIYTSTCETLRSSKRTKPITEEVQTTLPEMLGNYGRSKFLAEEHVKSCAKIGLSVIIINPTGVIGPYDINVTPPGALLLDYCKGRIPAYFETGFNVVDVRDVAMGHILAARHGKLGERYILGGSNVMLTETFELIKKISNKKPFSIKIPYFIVAAGLKFVRNNPILKERVIKSRQPFFFDCKKASIELNWKPSYSLQTTISDAWKWYMENSLC